MSNEAMQRHGIQIHRKRRATRAGEGVTVLNLGQREGWQCWYCGQPLCPWLDGRIARYAVVIGGHRFYGCEAYPEIEHTIPQSIGGPTTFANCVLACQTCNDRKGVRTANEYLEELYYWELEHIAEMTALRKRWAEVLEHRHAWW